MPVTCIHVCVFVQIPYLYVIVVCEIILFVSHWCSQALIVLFGGDLNSFVSVVTLLCYIYIYMRLPNDLCRSVMKTNHSKSWIVR